MNEFLAHWAAVDAALGAPLVVPAQQGAAIDRVNFGNLRATLIVRNTEVIDALNGQEIARGEINLRKAAQLDRLREFTQLVNTYWQGTGFASAVPKLPSISDGQERFLAPLRDMVSLWARLDAAPAPGGITLPLTLADGTVQATAAADVAALDAAFATEATAAQAVTIARATRDVLKAQAYLVMKNYRLAVPPRCALFPALVETLPALTPAAGHTPAPVNVSAVFVPPDQAQVAYDASTDPDLARYELRGNPGEHYQDDDAVVVATHAPADPREFTTGFGLNQPGAQVALKVYVVLTTGNEAGSAALLVQRPL
jgi:hypothetical protein